MKLRDTESGYQGSEPSTVLLNTHAVSASMILQAAALACMWAAMVGKHDNSALVERYPTGRVRLRVLLDQAVRASDHVTADGHGEVG